MKQIQLLYSNSSATKRKKMPSKSNRCQTRNYHHQSILWSFLSFSCILFPSFLSCHAEIINDNIFSRSSSNLPSNSTNHDRLDDDNGLPIKMWARGQQYPLKDSDQHGADSRPQGATSTIKWEESAATRARNQPTITIQKSEMIEPKGTTYATVIIGAGWAGIAAAKKLKSKGISNFIVLEARDYIGGRSQTITESWSNYLNVPLDLGSQWVHGTNKNPVQTVVKTFNIPYASVNYSQKLYQPNNGGVVADSEVDSLWTQLYDNGFMPYQAKLQDSTNTDKSLRSVATDYKNKQGLTAYKTMFYESFLKSSIVQEYAASLEDLSLWWWDMDSGFSGGDVMLYNGFSGAINAYASSVASKIFTEAKVTKIDHRSIPVKVTYMNSQGNSVTVQAQKVLVTVPLGVLQQGSINFVPLLPLKKRTAINKLGMGLMNKVILLWSGPSDVFWPTSTEWFADLTDRNTNMEFFNPYMYNGGKPLLVGFVSGREAKNLEDQFGNDEAAYKSELKNIALVALRNMFGSGNVPEPDDVIVSKWGKDPYSYGSYSYNKLGVYRTSRSTLSATVNNRLFFGGEATHPKYFQTVHGALISGQTAGTRIWNSLRRKRKRTNAE